AAVRRHRLSPAPPRGIARDAARQSRDSRGHAPRAPHPLQARSRFSSGHLTVNMAPPKRRSFMPGKLILVRHGQSTWNVENLFTGWHDVDLSEQGRLEARSAGVEIRKAGLVPDICFTSVLKRAIRTLWILADETGPTRLAAEQRQRSA